MLSTTNFESAVSDNQCFKANSCKVSREKIMSYWRTYRSRVWRLAAKESPFLIFNWTINQPYTINACMNSGYACKQMVSFCHDLTALFISNLTAIKVYVSQSQCFLKATIIMALFPKRPMVKQRSLHWKAFKSSLIDSSPCITHCQVGEDSKWNNNVCACKGPVNLKVHGSRSSYL